MNTRNLTLTSAIATIGLVWLASGCSSSSPSAFSTRFPDNQTDDVSQLVSAVSSASRGDTPTIAVGVSTAPVGLYGYDLSSHRVLWKQATQLNSSPILAGSLVLVQNENQVVARELATGNSSFVIDSEGMELIGADGDARGAVIVLASGEGTMSHSKVLMYENGSLSWTRDLDFRAGRPALAGEVVLVPWGNLFLSGLTRAAGVETARIRVTDGVLAQVFMRDGAAYTGSEEGVAQVDTALGRGSIRTSTFLAPPREELPGRPAFLNNVYRKDQLLTFDSARHSIQLAWNPTRSADGRVNVENNIVYLVFYRFVFALDYPSLGLRWIHTHGNDIIGAQAESGGLAIADSAGNFAWLDAKAGAVIDSQSTDLASSAVVMPARMPWPAQSQAEAPPEQSARQQLVLAAEDADARLVPVRRFAVKLLAELSDPQATADLFRLCDDERTAPAVRQDACDALASRESGTGDLLTGLNRHQDYLAGTRTPPVAALAKAAAKQKESRAVPALVAHLNDPQTPSGDLVAVVQALVALDPQAALAPLTAFTLTYHADNVDEGVVKALDAAIVGLATIGGAGAVATLRQLVADPLSLGSVRTKAAAMLAEIDKSVKMQEQQAAEAEAANATEGQPAAEAEEKPKGPPPRLSLPVVHQTLLPVLPNLRACLTAEGRNLFRGRIILVTEDDKLQVVSVVPTELQACMEPIVRSVKFPKTQDASRQQISYTVERK